MDTKQAFRDGFIDKLADMGVEPEYVDGVLKDSETRMSVHNALSALVKYGESGAVASLAQGLTNIGAGTLAAMLLVPPLAGGLLGYTLSPRTSAEDIQAMKDMELLKEYQSALGKLEEEKKRELKAL